MLARYGGEQHVRYVQYGITRAIYVGEQHACHCARTIHGGKQHFYNMALPFCEDFCVFSPLTPTGAIFYYEVLYSILFSLLRPRLAVERGRPAAETFPIAFVVAGLTVAGLVAGYLSYMILRGTLQLRPVIGPGRCRCCYFQAVWLLYATGVSSCRLHRQPG